MLNQILMYLMALGVLLGGADCIFGNRWGLGAKFEEGFRLLGPIALSMAGIVCITPLIAGFCRAAVAPLLLRLGIDPGICGGILPVDAGGYPLSLELAQSPRLGSFAGVVIGATFGCTIAFVIPVGMGTLDQQGRQDFAAGLLIGLAALPVALVVGGIACGLSVLQVLYQSLPILLLCLLLLWGIVRCSAKMIRIFTAFAGGIRALTLLGLILGAVQHLTGLKLIPNLTPLKDAMETVCSIGIVLLGCLPLSELLRRALEKPIHWVGSKTGLDSRATTAMLIGLIIAMPAISMLRDMDRRGRIVNGAILVCSASALSAHLAFTLGVAPDFVPALLVSKLAGSMAAAAAAIVLTKKKCVLL